ncbi:YhdP family protein [Thiocystis violacea]|uniref:YhdP family protein n=1 Tax=Thiocystis violacea TaxID=13725 RepID=UPI001908C7BF|nr:YhdP family protein [Thiocystis violacea]
MTLLIAIVPVSRPIADQAREILERTLSERLGYRVSIGSLRLGLAGLKPRLTLRRVELADRDEGTLALVLKAMELELDLFESLRTRSPRIRSLTLIGANLVVERTLDGRLRILGLGGLGGDDPRALELFLRQGRLNLVDGELLYLDQGQGGKLLRLARTRLSLDNEGARHWLELSASPVPPEPIATGADEAESEPEPEPEPEPEGESSEGHRLYMAALLHGPAADPWSWSGGLYLRVDSSNLGLLVPPGLLELGRLDTESARLESWFRIQNGRLEQSLIRADLIGLNFSPPEAGARPPGTEPEVQPMRLRRFHALTQIRPLASGWRVRITDLGASLTDADLSGLNLDLRLNQDGKPVQLGVIAARLDLADLVEILKSSPWSVPEPLRAVLDRDPRGLVRDLALRVGLDGAGRLPSGWRASASLSGLGFAQRGSLPGLDGLDLLVSGDQDGGELRLGSEGLALDLNPLFDQPLNLHQLSGRLAWARQVDGGWRIQGRHLSLENADLAGRARLDLEFPADGGRPFMDLRASFHDGNGANVRPYLPAGIMQPQLVRWLDESIVSGRVVQADLIFRGALADYPFRKHQGRFELRLDFEDLRLDYQKGWPPIESAVGHLRFLDQGLRIQVDRGRILDSALSAGRAEIPNLWGAKRMLIHGEAQGPFSDGLRTLAETPLAKDLGRLAGILEVSGESRLALDIDLPFDKSRELGVAGRLTWPAPATLGIRGTSVVLSELGGAVRFTERGIDAESLSAKLWGQPVGLSIATEGAGDPETSVTRIQARARTPVKTLAERFPADPWRWLDGQLDWNLAVTLRNRDVNQTTLPLDFRLISPLRELSIALPSPLGKSAGASRDLDLSGRLVPGQSLSVLGHLGDLGAHLNFDLDGTSKRMARGRLRLGATEAPAPEAEGFYLDGSLAELDLSAWIDWAGAASRGSRQETAATDGSAFAGLDLGARRLLLGDLTLTDARLRADPGAEDWRFRVESNEVSGRVTQPRAGANRPLDVALDRLDLKRLLARPEDEPPRTVAPGDPDPIAGLPSLDLRIDRLHWGDGLLGRLDLALRNDVAGTRFPTLALSGPGLLTLKGDGDWIRAADGGRGRIDLTARTPDLGRLLAGLDESRALEAGEATAKVQLTWPGGLSAFALRRADGFLDLRVGSGRFLGVEPGVGRLLGFLNVGMIGRRLALDFSDLYGEGFAFERMGGRLAIGRGQARFDDFLIDGAAGKVIVAGLTDLSAQRLDQTVTVEPRLGSSVALASAVAGGPVVGAAVYLVDRVTGNPLDRLGRYQYRVTGPWGEPEWKRLGWEPLSGQDQSGETATKNPSPEPGQNHFMDLQ